MEVNALRKVPPFKYTVEEDRKRWISLLYPLSPMFLQLVKDINWAGLGLTYQLFGGTAYELYNAEYYDLTTKEGFNLHTYADPTADIDISVFYDPTKNINGTITNTTLFDEILKKVTSLNYYFVKHLGANTFSTALLNKAKYQRYEQVGFFNITLKYFWGHGYRIRIECTIGTFTDHIMEFIIYPKPPIEVPSLLIKGFYVRDILYELYRNIAVINEDCFNSRKYTLSNIKAVNHSNRFIYGYKLLDILCLNKQYILSTESSYYQETLTLLFNEILNLLDNVSSFPRYKTFLTEPVYSQLETTFNTCPKSKELVHAILNVLFNIKLEKVSTSTINTPVEIIQTFIDKFNTCTTAGGRRIKNRRKSQQNKKQRKTRKRST